MLKLVAISVRAMFFRNCWATRGRRLRAWSLGVVILWSRSFHLVWGYIPPATVSLSPFKQVFIWALLANVYTSYARINW